MSDVKGRGEVGKTQRHRNHRTQWMVAEITFVEQRYGQLPVSEIGGKPGRSVRAVRAAVTRMA
ncbi:hypothetical protein D6T51_07670 [Salmonella enterica subsp. enterica serovar Muenchen]|nr:hypothetical protein [Salmonella enterica subsp. enterica serovar Muenchen]